MSNDAGNCRATLFCFAAFLLLTLSVPAVVRAQTQPSAKLIAAEPTPLPALSAILTAFDKYEVVGMPEAHGLKDLDDFILLLLRNPAFPEKVNDIVVECGNSRYQSILDRYIAGESVPFDEVQKVWRNTTESMCGTSGFYEQLFPLVRAINQQLEPRKRLRVLAADSPVDWSQLSRQNIADAPEEFFDRDRSIASVMKKEVLSKNRKALMLFGVFHLMHGPSDDRVAVASYERDYPNVTFVVCDLTFFRADLQGSSRNPFAAWPVPSLALAKGTWLGALDISHFFPPPIWFDKDCKVVNEFHNADLRTRMAKLVDAFLYLGPTELALKEQMPADIALDADYMKEMHRRDTLIGDPEATTKTQKELDESIVKSVETPLIQWPKPPDSKVVAAITQSCLEQKKQSGPPK
jgi:hypothetical protein